MRKEHIAVIFFGGREIIIRSLGVYRPNHILSAVGDNLELIGQCELWPV